MLPFQNTTLYKKTLAIVTELLKTAPQKEHDIFQQKIEEEALSMSQNLAKAFNQENAEEKQQLMQAATENIYGLLNLLEIKRQTGANEVADKIIPRLIELQNDFKNFPQKQKRILILSASFGQGHMSASKAIQQGFEEQYGCDFKIEIVDFGAILSQVINKAVKKLYDGSTKFTPKIYKMFFEGTNQKWQYKLMNLINYPLYANKITKFFKEHHPDIVISTFPFWDYIAIDIWKKHSPGTKFISIVTDSITIHRSWVLADTDYYMVANADTAAVLEKFDVDPAKIKTFGFPVKLDFLTKIDRESFLQKHNLDPKLFTVLFLPSGQTQKKNAKIVNELMDLEKNINIIAITGRDEKAKKLFEDMDIPKNLKIIGWTEEMPSFIKSADVVISKAGGATVMECFAAEKPIIISSIIDGQEIGNGEIIKKYQLGIIPSHANMNIKESINYIQNNLESFQKNLKKMSQPDAALKIAAFIKGL